MLEFGIMRARSRESSDSGCIDKSNKSMQSDNLRGVCPVVSLSLHFTTGQTPHKLRLIEALDSERKNQNLALVQRFLCVKVCNLTMSLYQALVIRGGIIGKSIAS